MNKIWTREELTALTMEEFEKLTPEEQIEVRAQGRAFREQYLDLS